MRNRPVLFAVTLLLLFASCSGHEPESWSELIPDKTPFLLVADENQSFREALQAPFIPLLDNLTPATVSSAAELTETAGGDFRLLATLLYPDTSNDWKPVWLLRTREGAAERLAGAYQRRFAQNRYRFLGESIEILQRGSRSWFLLELGSYTILSESSLAIEDMLRTLHGQLPAMEPDDARLRPGLYIVNTPNLERWLEQISDIIYRPLLQNAFSGSGLLALSGREAGERVNWRLEGEMDLEQERAPLIHAVSSPTDEFLLDRYIPLNTAAFSLLRLEPRRVPPEGFVPAGSLDEHLLENESRFGEISSSLHSELAFTAFAETGFMSSSEFVFIRRLSDPAALRRTLQSLESDGLIEALEGGAWYVNSPLLGRLIGGDLSPLGAFYLSVHEEAAILSRSNSLVNSIGNDQSRRRVVFYEENYSRIRQNLDSGLSSFTYVDAPAFNSFVQPWLFPQNYVGALSSELEIITIATAVSGENSRLRLEIASHSRETTRAPFVERWNFPMQGELSGRPVLTDITGSARDELIFATREGSVYVLAADGSPVMQASTLPDRPVGSPVVYDWYGNNQNVIMLAAGNKIYAWNEAGSLLPNFPVVLDEQITTPLQVDDVTRNGVAEMIVATADRNVHILNARGNPISGWPQTTNSTVNSAPLLATMGDQRSLFAFAENGAHAWSVSGVRRSGFPLFIDSQLNGSPAVHGDHLFGSGADGRLYGVSPGELFTAAGGPTRNDSLGTRSVNVANSALINTPAVYNEMLRVDGELVREDLIVTQAANGSVQLYNTRGVLRFTQSMGQPASPGFSPILLDLNGNNRTDVIALADSGRLHAWDLISGNRIADLPASAMQYPVFRDLNSDGNMEIIAQTQQGLRVWTVYR